VRKRRNAPIFQSMEARKNTSMARRITQPKTRQPSLRDTDRLYAAVAARDKSFDGAFVYSVATTGIYCRPSCPSRPARRENMAFHASCAAAEAAGFRPCKRCKPDAPSLDAEHARRVAEACRLIEDAEEPPALAALAGAVGLSPYHFHRVFKSITGVTPKAYASAHRQKRLRDTLIRSTSVTAAIHEAGFNSSGRFYANADEVLGMTPTTFRAGGKDMQLRFAIGKCSLGAILVAASAKGIAAILLGDDPEALMRDLETRFPSAALIGGDRDFEEIVAKAIALIEAPGTRLDLPLDVRGTAFQHRVWQALREIPAGTTVTYTELARRIGLPKAARAVAAACAANRIAVAIPCHRVVRNDGELAGYRWGVDRKRKLLVREQRS
jgi:AraC family transcriptional regulator, regulatory protein of adaptative response / methylated-DNA-[protein]-cysteine methyltransferase